MGLRRRSPISTMKKGEGYQGWLGARGSGFGAIAHSPQPPASSGLVRGQSVLEYAVLIAVVVAALLAMNVYIRRAVQGNLKALEDQINADAIK